MGGAASAESVVGRYYGLEGRRPAVSVRRDLDAVQRLQFAAEIINQVAMRKRPARHPLDEF